MTTGPTTGGPPAGQPTTATSATGSIYDLGYQRYLGPRLGRSYAAMALVAHSLRGTFGIGRGGRAKVVPFGLLVVALFPAIIAVGITGLASRFTGGAPGGPAQLITYERYWSLIGQVVVLFCAAQAPELIGRDQRSGVLSLYFSRALRRADYVLARYVGLVVGIAIVILIPQLVLLVGRILAATDIVATTGSELGEVPSIVGQAILASTLLGGISLAIAAYTPRRAYAIAAIIAALVIPPAVATVVAAVSSGSLGDYVALISAPTVLIGTNAFFFGAAVSGPGSSLPTWVFVAAAMAGTLASLAILINRYRRITA